MAWAGRKEYPKGASVKWAGLPSAGPRVSRSRCVNRLTFRQASGGGTSMNFRATASCARSTESRCVSCRISTRPAARPAGWPRRGARSTSASTFLRLYAFLSQIFDYGNTDIEKRAIFFKVLLPLLEFGREREGVDLSKIVLTHHQLRSHGKRDIPLAGGEVPKLQPITESGAGSVQEKQKALLREIIEKVNDLFTGELTDQDKLVYVNNVLLGKLMESETLRQQARNNTKEQFANSPDLTHELLNAVMAAYDAHTAMSTQALNSEAVRGGLKDILLNYSGLWEGLRGLGETP